MKDYNFQSSFLMWTSTGNNHTPRLQIEAACALDGPRAKGEFFLTEMCTGEQMYVDKDVIHLPANEFAVVYSPAGEFVFFKYFADMSRNISETHRVGEAMSTQDGRGTPIVDMSVQMARWSSARELREYADIREAVLGNRPLNAQSEYVVEDGTKVTMTYPVKICNISNSMERWQIDTPLLVPDFSARTERPVGMFRPGYIVFNAWTWAEVIMRSPNGKGGEPSHFSDSRRLEVTNRLFAVR